MIIKINDERGFEQSTLYFGYLEENNSTTIEFELPEYLEKYNKKLNFLLYDGTTVCKLFNDINLNKFTFTRDLLKFNKLQMAIEFFDTEENLIYRTSILTIRISDSIICDDDISEDDPKVVILDTLIQKVTELDSTLTENESVRAENESERETNENVRISNENTRISNENKRSEEENNRISAESTRVSNESKRVESENLRIAQEETRQSNESTRTSNEEIREENETQRIANEEIRQEKANQLSTTIEKKMNKTTEKISLIAVSTESGAKGIDGNIVENPANTFKTFNVEGIDEVYVNGRNHWPNEPLVIFYDNTNTLISYIDTGENSQTCQDFKVEVPENAVTMIVNGRTEDPTEAIPSAYYYEYLDFKESFDNEIEKILKILPSKTTEIQETIDVDDAAESSFNQLSVFGNNKQESTEGRNLLYEIRSGYLTTVENQEATTTEESQFGNWQIYFKNKDGSTSISLEAGEYYVSLDLKINSGSVSSPLNLIALSNKDGQETINNPIPTTTYQRYCFKSILNSAKNVNYIIIQKHYDEEICSFKIKNVMISKMSDYIYEPYTGGNPSPNPDYPQEIESIKDSITFKRIGKNYNKYPYYDGNQTSSGVNYEILENYTIQVTGSPTDLSYFDFQSNNATSRLKLKKGTYTFSATGLQEGLQISIYITDKNGNNLKSYYIHKDSQEPKTITFDNDIELYSFLHPQKVGYTFNTIVSFQIEKGTEATEYEPYNEDVYTLPVQQEMLEEDTFEKVDGNWYEVHTWEEYEVTGNEAIQEITISNEGYPRYAMLMPLAIDVPNKNIVNVISNMFKGVPYSQNEAGAYGSKDLISMTEYSGTKINFRLSDKTINTVDLFKAFLQELYAAGTPVRIYYKLETPTKLPCTEKQTSVLNQLEQFSLSKGINHIFSDDELSPKFQLKYYQDMNILLDKINKNIADASAQII